MEFSRCYALNELQGDGLVLAGEEITAPTIVRVNQDSRWFREQ